MYTYVQNVVPLRSSFMTYRSLVKLIASAVTGFNCRPLLKTAATRIRSPWEQTLNYVVAELFFLIEGYQMRLKLRE